MNIDKIAKYSPLLLRTSIGIVFLWFGFSQLKNPSSWTRMVPEYATSIIPIQITNLIFVHGLFEIILAILLILGLYTRTASLLLGLNLLHITTIVGYGPTGARDFALFLATLSIFLHGADKFCLDNLIKKKEEKDS